MSDFPPTNESLSENYWAILIGSAVIYTYQHIHKLCYITEIEGVRSGIVCVSMNSAIGSLILMIGSIRIELHMSYLYIHHIVTAGSANPKRPTNLSIKLKFMPNKLEYIWIVGSTTEHVSFAICAKRLAINISEWFTKSFTRRDNNIIRTVRSRIYDTAHVPLVCSGFGWTEVSRHATALKCMTPVGPVW